jgi:uncharacterized protein (DUF1015 family)
MVDLQPFHGIRYAPDAPAIRESPLEALIAPPYDVISDRDLDGYYARDPHNIVRIDLNRPEPGDAELARYTRANDFFTRWLEAGVLRRDAEAALYVLTQRFTGPDGVERVRTGFFSRARLQPFDAGVILPHERTLRGPKVDRLNLYRATRASLSPIFGAYADPQGAVRGALEAALGQSAPVATARFLGVENRLYALTDAAAVAAIVGPLADAKLYIADGHHRYETALAYRDEQRAAHGRGPSDAGPEFVLMFASAVEDPGMVIFPTHRLVTNLASLPAGAALDAELEAKLAPFFERAPLGDASPREAQAALGARRSSFVLKTATAATLLTLREDAPLDAVRGLPQEPALRLLDVSVLHAIVLEHLLGISAEAQATQANLRYSKDFGEAFAAPSSGVGGEAVQLALLMNPTRMDEVVAVAESGAVMPQKSTFFYPKIPTGLVLYPFA